MHTAIELQAESQIRDTGARLTRPRARVLAFLLEQNTPLTHHEIRDGLAGGALDAVTLYRVLEWLTEKGLVHRIASADQVWRFNAGAGAAPNRHGHRHAHFQCTSCGTVTCFTDIALPKKIELPPGYVSDEIEFLIKGSCPRCKNSR